MLRRRLRGCQAERASLQARVAQLERESRRTFASYVEAEAKGLHFAHLYLTVQRLRGARGRDDIYAAVREIIEDIVGSDEIAVFERSEDGVALRPVGAFGIDPAPYAGVIGQVVLTGRPYFREGVDPGDEAVSACLPLAAEGRILGAVAVFHMLPQKPALSPLDREILGVLAAHAAAVLLDGTRPMEDGA